MNSFDQNRLTLSGQIKEIMLQGSKLGREPLHLLNDLASFYPVCLAQFLTGDDNFYHMSIPRYNLLLAPWKDWDAKTSPAWWSEGYNKIKHKRDEYYNNANLFNALNAVGGLLCGILYYYKCIDCGYGIDYMNAPRLFVPHGPTSNSSDYISAGGGFWCYYTPDV